MHHCGEHQQRDGEQRGTSERTAMQRDEPGQAHHQYHGDGARERAGGSVGDEEHDGGAEARTERGQDRTEIRRGGVLETDHKEEAAGPRLPPYQDGDEHEREEGPPTRSAQRSAGAGYQRWPVRAISSSTGAGSNGGPCIAASFASRATASAAPMVSSSRSGPPRNAGNPMPNNAPTSPSRGVRTTPSLIAR